MTDLLVAELYRHATELVKVARVILGCQTRGELRHSAERLANESDRANSESSKLKLECDITGRLGVHSAEKPAAV